MPEVRSAPVHLASALRFGMSAWLLMLTAGSMYGLSAVQVGLPLWTGCSEATSTLPFGMASLGLAGGCFLAGKMHDKYFARTTASLGGLIWAAGLYLAGSAIQRRSLLGVCIALGFGGIGVGLVYLTVVVNVGRRLSSSPRVGGFIGPLGFASGTALTLLCASTSLLKQRDPHWAGATLQKSGLLAALATGLTVTVLPSGSQAPTLNQSANHKASLDRPKHLRALFWLIFANAFPGMTLLGIALPLVSGTDSPPGPDACHAIVYATIFLFLGGFFAPHISRLLGVKGAIVTMLGLRSSALHACSIYDGKTPSTLTLALILFGHGFGFSLLPGLIKRDGSPRTFCREYGTVLVAWGLSGFLGGWVNVASLNLGIRYRGTLGFCGMVTGISAITLSVSTLADERW